ncbi:EamA family transporter RarD [Desulfopila inferna]|uniref:EamA family transporter RarD n=1 Tax=Desulfopila inferna TaxID=468528 RepID=UPI001965D21E|nr:EamA family transporter RarD [Desulfopila inferna]MBM9606053.1 EamA family transporter RarD [Desulfopila inferna]
MNYNKGMAAATSSFVMWGLLPIYWKLLDTVPAYEILSHRMAWSLVVTLALLAITGHIRGFFQLFREIRQLSYFLLTALILSMNWFIYIWSVNSGHIVEASLGYFINPLVSVCFGVIFLKERMRKVQWISVFLAFLGVSYLTWIYGEVPWIALSLAITFACYGLLRKITTVPALEGLCLETSILFLPACAFLLYFEIAGSRPFLQGSLMQAMLLAGTGVATTAPLLCFCYAAQKIPLFLVGLLQYLSPSISLFVGIFVYHEPFPAERMLGFAIIWMALALLIWDGLSHQVRAWRIETALKKM